VTQLRATTDNAADVVSDALIVMIHTPDNAKSPKVLAAKETMSGPIVAEILASFAAVANGDTKSVRITCQSVAAKSVVVCPVTDPTDTEKVRRTIGAAVRGLNEVASVSVVPPSQAPPILRAICEGALLGVYRFTNYKSGKHTPIAKVSVLVTAAAAKTARVAVKEARALIDGVNLTRDLVNTPPNDLSPQALVEVAQAVFDDRKVGVKVWSDRTLRRDGFGGLTAVGQGSVNGPRLVRLRYRHPKAKVHIALVGKGITFDSGGLSLKPPKSMEWMKSDMAGSAAVLATLRVVHDWGLPINVTGWLAAAENMPSATAQRPGDIITINGGKTVEVLNTDAEGRLVLADALVEAAKDNPDEIIDIATLTGAQLVALGALMAGAMGNNDQLREAIVAAGTAAGESLWPMPLPPELRASLDSPIADLANIGDRNGGMLTAALFLNEFVPAEIPWSHLDIAGPSFNEAGASGYIPKGGTGFGVRTLSEYLRQRSQ